MEHVIEKQAAFLLHALLLQSQMLLIELMEIYRRLNNPPSKYINTILIPRDSEVPVVLPALKNQGIYDVVIVDSLHYPKVGITFDPKALIQTLANLLPSSRGGYTNEIENNV